MADRYIIKRITADRSKNAFSVEMYSEENILYTEALEAFRKEAGAGNCAVLIRLRWGVTYQETVASPELKARLWKHILSFLSVNNPGAQAVLSSANTRRKITFDGFYVYTDKVSHSILAAGKIQEVLRDFLADTFGESVPFFLGIKKKDADMAKRAANEPEEAVGPAIDEEQYEKEINATIKKNR
ncbi:MAG: hypothetical protein J5912_04250, partial [Clostridia bacterium]|nr:hypothetical protein [Clostridia bacterium]